MCYHALCVCKCCQCLCDGGVESCDNGHCKVVTLQTLSLFQYINISQQLDIPRPLKCIKC